VLTDQVLLARHLATQIKNPVSTPNPFLSGFKAYDDGGEVVISSNVDKDLL
jgi:hypothetical protein